LKTFLIASGGDDGNFKVWDLRMFEGRERDPLLNMNYHKQPITSIEWHPEDESVLICGCADNQTTIWDMDMKKEDEELGAGSSAPSVPSQLLFVHQGQQDVKEVHWHPQIPGLLGSTALDNFHIFKTINS
jgi:ribosome assembly protein RRB1